MTQRAEGRAGMDGHPHQNFWRWFSTLQPMHTFWFEDVKNVKHNASTPKETITQPGRFCFPEQHRDHRNCKQNQIPWQGIQLQFVATDAPVVWKTHRGTGQDPKEANPLHQVLHRHFSPGSKVLQRAKPKLFTRKDPPEQSSQWVWSPGFPHEELGGIFKFEMLSLGGRSWCWGGNLSTEFCFCKPWEWS